MSRLACLLPALAMMTCAAAAHAQPFPGTSVLPDVIPLVGRMTSGTGPDPGGVFTVIVNDALGFPIAGALVTVEFDGCAQLDIATAQNFPGVTLVGCTPPVVSALTNLAGEATFAVLGSVVSRTAAEPAGPCAEVWADEVGPPVLLGMVPVAAFDQDGVNGLRANDVALFGCDFFDPGYEQRSDFNGSGTLSLVDLSIMAQRYFPGASNETGPRCDGESSTTPLVTAPDGDLFLAWATCTGSPTLTFACDDDFISYTLIGSMTAPAGVDALTGYEVTLDVIGEAGVPLADWWRLDPAGCRFGSFSMATGPSGCPNALAGPPPIVMYSADPPSMPINRATIRIVGAGSATGNALVAGTEYTLFRLLLDTAHTTSADPPVCAGCTAPVALVLRSVRLTQPAAAGGTCDTPAISEAGAPDPLEIAGGTGDVIVYESSSSSTNIAYFNGVPPGFVVTDATTRVPSSLWLGPASPNPVRSSAMIPFALPRESQVSIGIYDLAGRQVRELMRATLPAGHHAARWDRRDGNGAEVGSGVYFIRLKTPDQVLGSSIVAVR